MGLNWWWVVVLAVVVVALLVAVTLLRTRRRRADAIPPTDVEIAAAAAGGAAGAFGAGAVAATHAGEPPPVGGEAAARVATDSSDAAAPVAAAAAPGSDGPGREPPVGGQPLDENAPADGVAPGELSGSSDQMPEPAGSALAALDSGLIGPATTFTAAAAAVSAATVRPGPYPGSLLAAADGSAPSPDHRVKANEGSRRYHTPDSPYYVRTRGDAWFRTPEEARAAGFTAWDAGR